MGDILYMKDNFTENDWKLFKSKIPVWQENYMQRLISEYIDLLNENTAPSDKFWKLEKRINQDKNHHGVKIELKRFALISNLVILIQCDVIEFSDLEEFSTELKDTVIKISNIKI